MPLRSGGFVFKGVDIGGMENFRWAVGTDIVVCGAFVSYLRAQSAPLRVGCAINGDCML